MLEDFDYRGVTSAEKRGQSELPKGAKPYQPDNILSQGRASTTAVQVSREDICNQRG